MPIIPISPTPTFGSDTFPAVEGNWAVGQFQKHFASGGTDLDQAECEKIFNNEESTVV